ncbi:hypothetical protein [Fructobacillus tropaeoli]|nr:hypothetical protein [Fructobacillus tropaeoli]
MDNKKINNDIKFKNLTELGLYIGISRQTASNRLKIRGWKGRLSFTSDELELLKGNTKQNVNVNDRQLLIALNKQIEAQNETIKSLNEQLINSQKLQLMSQQHAEQLTNELHDLKKIEAPKQGFWARMFGKQK